MDYLVKGYHKGLLYHKVTKTYYFNYRIPNHQGFLIVVFYYSKFILNNSQVLLIFYSDNAKCHSGCSGSLNKSQGAASCRFWTEFLFTSICRNRQQKYVDKCNKNAFAIHQKENTTTHSEQDPTDCNHQSNQCK